MEGHRVTAHDPVQPIFIVGMPGSGTTVPEQIFAAHPQCHGGGELPFLPRIRRLSERITKKDYPHALLTVPRLVDKLPYNFLDAALICALFPEARVIALRRDYRAIALSNYFQHFAAKRGTLGYAFDLEAMGHHLRDVHQIGRAHV